MRMPDDILFMLMATVMAAAFLLCLLSNVR